MYITNTTITLKLVSMNFKPQVLTSSAVKNNNIKTTLVFGIIPSIDSDVGPRASMQSTSAFFINEALTFNRQSDSSCKKMNW